MQFDERKNDRKAHKAHVQARADKNRLLASIEERETLELIQACTSRVADHGREEMEAS